MFKIHNVGEGLGDCFFIEIGEVDEHYVIMIDGRTKKDYSYIKEKLKQFKKVDYLIITHCDDDHLAGVIECMRDNSIKDKFADTVIVYNFVTKTVINYKTACVFEKLKKSNNIVSSVRYSYNEYNRENFKMLSLEKRYKFPITNDSCVYLTFLFPNFEGIFNVRKDYEQKRAVGNYTPKKDIVNYNSIVFLIEYKGKKALFMGDNSINNIKIIIRDLKNINEFNIDGRFKIDFKKDEVIEME